MTLTPHSAKTTTPTPNKRDGDVLQSKTSKILDDDLIAQEEVRSDKTYDGYSNTQLRHSSLDESTTDSTSVSSASSCWTLCGDEHKAAEDEKEHMNIVTSISHHKGYGVGGYEDMCVNGYGYFTMHQDDVDEDEKEREEKAQTNLLNDTRIKEYLDDEKYSAERSSILHIDSPNRLRVPGLGRHIWNDRRESQPRKFHAVVPTRLGMVMTCVVGSVLALLLLETAFSRLLADNTW